MPRQQAVVNTSIQFRIIIPLIISLVIGSGCISGPDSPVTPAPTPWEDPDSAWKVIENLELAYITMDLELYMSCFREDFEFTYFDFTLPEPWTISWGYDTEEEKHQNMFTSVPDIDLVLTGDFQSPWTGDSTGASLQLTRTFDLKLYDDSTQTSGIRATGQALFICRQDSAGIWYVWLWYDQSDT